MHFSQEINIIMINIKREFRKFFGKLDFESKLFWVLVIMGTGAGIVSSIFTVIEGISKEAAIGSAAPVIVFVALMILQLKIKNINLSYCLLCLVLNIFVIPINFLICGGIDSGVLLYFIAGAYMVAYVNPKKLKYFTYALTLASFLGIMLLSYFKPETVKAISDDVSFLDTFVTFIIVSGAIFLVTNQIIVEYNKERKQNLDLIEKISFNSEHDELTGLYNRKVLFERLENEIINVDKNIYFCLLGDVDNFKKFNDTYGHVFGDKVLKAVANVFKEELNKSAGEFASRYGGEEFVIVLAGKNYKEILERAENIRRRVSETSFDEVPEAHVTISIGVCACDEEKSDDATHLLNMTDERMYMAKKLGKNRVVPYGENL